MKIGVTGHQVLNQEGAWEWVESQIDRFLDRQEPPLIGVSSLAAGADQLFAQRVMKAGGSLHVIVPFGEYRAMFSSHVARKEFDALIACAASTTVLERRDSDEESYLEAGRRVVDASDAIVAVWDGKPARGLGGTGDVVAYALKRGRPVHHLDPLLRQVSPL